MIGRGTRIDEPTGKLMFRVYDYTGATRLFGKGFRTTPKAEGGGTDPPPPPPIEVKGFEVHIDPLGRYVVMPVNGVATPVPVADYRAGLSRELVKACPDLTDFRRRWAEPAEREQVLDAVVAAGYSPSVLQRLEDKGEFDLYDVLADLGFPSGRCRPPGAPPAPRASRRWATAARPGRRPAGAFRAGRP